ncbi:unnamed protein product [Schistocephalus solidus]|uniref:Fibronectin type-III domain-containing protein n=1 Tax=Schistocephalus solidus TaxID=70667 RepID=A0A183SCQ9_SCHSO|nr:unnamed protein product [Schistocephalus solidus]
MPRGLNAMALNSTSIRVSWEPPKASTDLHFLVTFYSGVEHFNLETTETEYTPTELKPSSSFYITLRLLDADEIVVGTTSCTYAKTLPIGNF